MQYLVVAKIIYGVPFATEADSAEQALTNVTLGREQPGPAFVLQSLPTALWSVEPLEFVDAMTKMYDALRGVVSMFNEGAASVDWNDERVAAIYGALDNARNTIDKSRAIQKELSDRESSSSVLNEDS